MRKKFQLFPTILFILVASSLTLSCSSTKEMAAIDKEHTQSVSTSTLIIFMMQRWKKPLWRRQELLRQKLFTTTRTSNAIAIYPKRNLFKQAQAFFEKAKGVLQVNEDHIIQLD